MIVSFLRVSPLFIVPWVWLTLSVVLVVPNLGALAKGWFRLFSAEWPEIQGVQLAKRVLCFISPRPCDVKHI